MKPSISIAIPAFNEEDNLRKSVQALRDAIDDRFRDYEIWIIDDGSTDATGRIADELASADPKIRIVHHPRNLGMGASLRDGFERATMEYVGSYPADGGLDGRSLAEMFDRIGQADVLIPTIANPGFRPCYRQVISKAFVAILNRLFGLKVGYYNGHAIYRREQLQAIRIKANGHAFLAETLIRLLYAGARFLEIPTWQHHREHGSTKAFRMRNLLDVLTMVGRLFWDLRIRRN